MTDNSTTDNATTEDAPRKKTQQSFYYLNVFCNGGVCESCQIEADRETDLVRVITDSGVIHKFSTRAQLTRALDQLGAKPVDDKDSIEGLLILDCGCEALVIHGRPKIVITRTVTALD